MVEVVENNHRPHVVDEEEGDNYHPQDEEDPECADRIGKNGKPDILTQIYVERYSHSNNQDKVDQAEDNVGVDESLASCSNTV